MDKNKIRRKKKEYNILCTMFQRYILEDYEKSKLLALLAECLLREICRQIGKFRICLIEAGSSSREHVRNGSYLTRGGTAITRALHHLVSLYFRLLCILTREGSRWRTVFSPQVRDAKQDGERCNFSEKGRKEGERAIPTDHFFLFSLSPPPPSPLPSINESLAVFLEASFELRSFRRIFAEKGTMESRKSESIPFCVQKIEINLNRIQFAENCKFLAYIATRNFIYFSLTEYTL